MSKDINDILKEVAKSNKELHKVDDKISKEVYSLQKDISDTKKEIKIISEKIDIILELINQLYIFVEDDSEEDIEDNDEYESNEGWLPELQDWEEHSHPDEDDS
jgi:hypothetical protein